MEVLRVGVIALVLAGVSACGRPPEAPRRLPNVVFVLVDTLRADRLGVYGNTQGLTPFIDSLAARGVLFENAYAQSSWTNPSVASIFTSRFQSQHGVIDYGSSIRPAATLASTLRDFGYATGAFVGNGMLSPDHGFGRGFEEYVALWPKPMPPPAQAQKPRAKEVDKLALGWLDRLSSAPARPVLLYLHYLEPHLPYAPPPPLLARMFRGRQLPDLVSVSNRLLWAAINPPDEKIREDGKLAYDAEVASLDASLKGLFAELERRGVLRDAIVVFTSDHGEEFYEHGGYTHRTTLYNELIHVPLIIVSPGQQEGHRVSDVVSLVDIAPTLLDLIGTARPSSFEGRSLRRLLAPEDAGWWARLTSRRRFAPRPAFSELEPIESVQTNLHAHATAIVLGTRKLIANRRGEREVFDLTRDPGEQNPVTGDDAHDLQLRLADFVRQPDGTRPAASAPLDAETEQRLRALGYVK